MIEWGRKEMRGNNCFRKTWVVCILVLLVGTGIAPVMSGFLSENDIGDVQPFENESKDKNDTIPPVTTILLDPPSPNGYSGWYVSNVTVTLNATDNESGVNWTYCSLSPGGIYTGPILVSQSGQYHVTFYSVDYAGNVEPMKNVSLKIEKTPPGPSNIFLSTDGKNICITVTVYSLSGGEKVEFYFNDVLQETVTGVGPDYTYCFAYAHLPFFSIKVITYYSSGNVVIFEIAFGPRVFFVGAIRDLNDTGWGILRFTSEYVFSVSFHPFKIQRIPPDEEIMILRDSKGYLTSRFIFGVFLTITSIQIP